MAVEGARVDKSSFLVVFHKIIGRLTHERDDLRSTSVTACGISVSDAQQFLLPGRP